MLGSCGPLHVCIDEARGAAESGDPSGRVEEEPRPGQLSLELLQKHLTVCVLGLRVPMGFW